MNITSNAQFGRGSSSTSGFRVPADSMGSNNARSGRDGIGNTVGTMGSPMAMRTAGISGFGGGGRGASALGGGGGLGAFKR
jgi:hypothetical protein